jgi:hypothetical protein
MDLREKSEMVKGTPGSEISQRYRDAITALRKTDVLTELDFGDAIERVIESVSQYEQGISNEDNSFMLPCSEEDLVIFTIEIPSTVLTRFIVDISTLARKQNHELPVMKMDDFEMAAVELGLPSDRTQLQMYISTLPERVNQERLSNAVLAASAGLDVDLIKEQVADLLP